MPEINFIYTYVRKFVALTMAVMGVILPSSLAAFTVESQSVSFAEATEPVIYDLNGDGKYEIFLSGANGTLILYDSASLDPIWEQQVSSKPITAPAIASLTGDGSLQVVVASYDGSVYVLSPGKGRVITSLSLSAPLSLAPSVVRFEGKPDGIAVCDDNGVIHYLVMGNDGKLKSEFSVSNTVEITDTEVTRAVSIGRITRPATSGDITGDGSPEIIVGTMSGTVLAVPVNDPKNLLVWRGFQDQGITTGISLGDLYKSGKPHLIFGASAAQSSGELVILIYEPKPNTNVWFREVRRGKLLGPANGHLLVMDIDGDEYTDVIGASVNALTSFDGAAEFSYFGKQPFATHAPPLTAPSIVKRANGKPAVVVCDNENSVFLIDPLMNEEQPPRWKGPVGLKGTLAAGNITGSGKCEFVYFNQPEKKLTLVTLDEAAAADALPIMTHGVDFSRDGQWTPAAIERLAAIQKAAADAIDSKLTEARTAFEAGQKKEALALAEQAMDMAPTHADATALRNSILRSVNLVRNIILGIIVLAAAGAIGFFSLKAMRKKQNLKNAEQLVEQGDYASAITHYRQLYSSDPSNSKAVVALANAYMAAGEIPAEAAEALEQARKLHPDNPDYTIALARAYSMRGDETDAAQDAYLVALGSLTSERGKVAYHSANVFRRKGDNDQAIKYYKLALKEGHAEPEVLDRLADAFLDTRQYTEKTLPVYQAAASRKPADVRLNEAVCRSYLAARLSDERASKAADHLLSISPESLVALRLRAKCSLQAGHPQEAAKFAEHAHRISANDAETIAILSHAYIGMERTDEPALAVYREAHKLWPEQNSVLRVLALAIVRNQLTDDDSYDLLKKYQASELTDEEVLLGLSTVADMRGDHKTVIDSLNKILTIGRGNPDTYSRLADAYVATGELSANAEKALKEAVRADPENEAYLRALALIMVQGSRTDAEALQFLERAVNKDRQNLEIGKQYTRALLENERYEDAMKQVRWLLQNSKDDPELQKLFANASLFSNRLDDAIKQYEQLHRLHPDDTEATVNLALAYGHKQRTDDHAAGLYEKAIALKPTEGLIRVMFARHHALSGRLARGLEEFRQTIESLPKTASRVLEEVKALTVQFPDRADLRWFLANHSIELNHLSESVEQLQSIFEIDPSQARPVLQAYDRILEKDPNNLPACLRKGSLLKGQGRFEEARPLLEKAWKMNPGNPEAAAELEELYSHILKENDDVEIRFALGKLNYTQNDFDQAIGHFQKTSQDFRYENESIKMLGLCFVGKGMLEFALQEFKKLVVDEEMKEILYDLAQRYEAKNDLVGAKQVYRQLFAADIHYRDVKTKFEVLAGSTSDPMTLEKTALMTQLSEKARRRYELLEELGRGAMGIVYMAKDNELDEIVALKILPDNLSQNPEAVQRFKSEARSARRLSHPNIVRIHDIGEEMGRKYISMEFVKGSDLKKVLRMRGKLDPHEVAHMGAQIAAALDYAHTMQIVHRDVKPANMMINEQQVVKVSDFGIAKMLEMTGETMAGAIIGTPLYMSPEQVQGHPVDNRADIYSLGIMMYELASGRPPFTDGDLAYQHIKVPPKPLEDVPEALNEIIMKCLAKNRDDRWATAGEIWRALEKSGLIQMP